MLIASVPKNLSQSPVIPAVDEIAVPILLNISFLKAWKTLIQLLVEIFTVAFTQGQSHAHVQDPLHLSIYAKVKQCIDVFLSGVNVRQKRTQPNDCGDVFLLQSLKNLHPTGGCADIRFNHSA